MSEIVFSEHSTTPHQRECAWCGIILQFGREPVSHGICPLCHANELGVSVEDLARTCPLCGSDDKVSVPWLYPERGSHYCEACGHYFGRKQKEER